MTKIHRCKYVKNPCSSYTESWLLICQVRGKETLERFSEQVSVSLDATRGGRSVDTEYAWRYTWEQYIIGWFGWLVF